MSLPARRRDEYDDSTYWRLYGINGAKPPIRVKHSELEEFDPESSFKRYCPACRHGILMVYRHNDHPEYIHAVDRCSVCLQSVIYDIVDLRNSTGYPLVWESIDGMPDPSKITLSAQKVKRIRDFIETCEQREQNETVV